MKIMLLFSILAWGTTAVAVAQIEGFVTFANKAAGVDAPVSDAFGNRIIGPSPYVADLFWSTNTNALMDSLMPVGRNTSFSTLTNNGGGYFLGGAVGLPAEDVLTQVRVWDTTYGSTYYEARDKGGEFGFSNLIIVIPTPPPGGPASLIGLQSFKLQRLPHLTAILSTTNTILFSWPVEVTTYAVQQSLDLSPANWVTLSNSPVAFGQQEQVVLPVPPSGRMFYRLVSQ